VFFVENRMFFARIRLFCAVLRSLISTRDGIFQKMRSCDLKRQRQKRTTAARRHRLESAALGSLGAASSFIWRGSSQTRHKKAA
jgi:hypothetical protein